MSGEAPKPDGGGAPSGPPTGRGVGLATKLIAVTVALVATSFAAVWWISTDTSRRGLVELSDDNLALSAQNLARAVRGAVADTRADARAAAALDLAAEPMDSGDPKNFNYLANQLVQSKTKYAAIVAVDADGEIAGANELGNDGEELGAQLIGCTLEGPWLAEVAGAEKGEAFFIPPTRPSCLEGLLGDDEQVIGYALPVFDLLDDHLGAVVIFMSVDHVRELLEGYVSRTDARVDALALVLSHEGSVVALPAGIDDDPLGGGQLGAEALAGGTVTTPAGERYRVDGTSIGGAAEDAGWSVLLMRHQASFDAPVDQLSSSLFWVFVIAVLVVIVALTITGTRLLSPIGRLTEAVAKTTRAGDFRELEVETRDEVGALTRTFNRIFGTLKEYEEGLEQKVAERTAELRDAKQEVSDILDNMAQAIFTVGEGRKVNQEYSAYCAELLGDVPITGVDALDLLRLEDGSPPRKSLSFWLDTVIGGNELQWALAGGNGPVKELTYERPGDGEERVLQLEYAPIYHAGTLTKVMIIARDMTTVVRLQEEVIRKEDENRENLERVAELAQLDPELFQKFLAEADEIVTRCHEALASLRADLGDRGAVDALFRGMHTLKANARIFKMTSVQNVAHEAEDQFQKVRDGERELTTAAVDDFEAQLATVRERLDAYDRLGQRVLLGQGGGDRDAFARADKPLEALGEIARRFDSLLLAADEGAARTDLDDAIARSKDLASRLGSLGMSQLAGKVVETLERIERSAADGLDAAKDLARAAGQHLALHRELVRLPDAGAFLEESEPMCKAVAEDLARATTGGVDTLNAVLGTLHSLKAHARSSGILSIQDLAHGVEDRLAELRDKGEPLGDSDGALAARELGRVLALVGDAEQILDNAAPEQRRQKGATMRIPAARVMEVRRVVKQLARAVEGRQSEMEITEAYAALDAAVRELTVVPLGDLFDRMKKMVLDLSIEVGKPTEDLVTEGEDVSVDTKLIEKMRDVLTHALRNAIDHGIEPPGERPSDKPKRATIAIRAAFRGNDLVVAVEDDGRGIDIDRVRATAVQRQKLSEEDAAGKSDEELIELLFTPGFSTASRVTDLSGRGVGLDVIRTTMRDLKGDAQMSSTRGKGATLTLTIPAEYYQEL